MGGRKKDKVDRRRRGIIISIVFSHIRKYFFLQCKYNYYETLLYYASVLLKHIVENGRSK